MAWPCMTHSPWPWPSTLSLVQLTPVALWVETRGERTLGMTVADRRAPERQAEAPATIEVALEVDAARMLASLLNGYWPAAHDTVASDNHRPGCWWSAALIQT